MQFWNYSLASFLLSHNYLSLHNIYLSFFIKSLNIFLCFYFFFICVFVIVIRSYYKGFSNDDGKDRLLSVVSMSLISFFFCFFFLELYANNITLFEVQNYILWGDSANFANLLFVILFVIISPITITLLVRKDRFSIFFCILNFLLLFLIVLYMVVADNIIGLVMGYELLFIPSFFIMRQTVYSSSAQSAYSVFTVWSVIGSLLVVSGAVYLLCVLESTAFSNLNNTVWKFTDKEMFFVTLLFFIGFGVKIPVWPFHYWLTRVHVEASTGFSIFLSGFLVKAAVFVCWKVIVGVGLTNTNLLFTCVCLYSVFDGVIKLPLQTDLKKQVAFATVFEMGLIFLFLMWKPVQSFFYIFIFCFSHALLSGLMFFLVEVVYARTQTRNVDLISGLSVFFPTITKFVWMFLFVFWGLPFTLKFFIELWVLISFFNSGSLFLFLFILFILFFSNVFVTKTWLQIVYGSPSLKIYQADITFWETSAMIYLIFANSVSAVAFTYWLA